MLLVGETGLEPVRLSAADLESAMSTNSITPHGLLLFVNRYTGGLSISGAR